MKMQVPTMQLHFLRAEDGYSVFNIYFLVKLKVRIQTFTTASEHFNLVNFLGSIINKNIKIIKDKIVC